MKDQASPTTDGSKEDSLGGFPSKHEGGSPSPDQPIDHSHVYADLQRPSPLQHVHHHDTHNNALMASHHMVTPTGHHSHHHHPVLHHPGMSLSNGHDISQVMVDYQAL